MMQKDKIYIAFVCTGNTCRSPMAEAIFNKLADEKNLNVRALSFGLSAPSGLSVSENSQLVCREIGIDLSGKTSTAVTDMKLEQFERFYCMSQSHARMLSEYFNISASKITVMNVPDPYGGDVSVYRQCREKILNIIGEMIYVFEKSEN